MSINLQQHNAKLAFIGAGNMAASLIGGLCDNGFPAELITASDPNAVQLDNLSQLLGINSTTDNLAAIADADAIVLAVKPQIMESVISPLASLVQGNKPVIISIAAGITVANITGWLGPGLPIIRTMPNTPALVQTGATGLYGNAAVTATQHAIADTIFQAVGDALWFDEEEDLDKVVALSGSGPAYFFLVMEAIQKAAENMGLEPAAARALTLQTALGSAKLASADEAEFSELRRRVTSPGGTTEKAIKCMQEDGLEGLIEKAMLAAQARSKELAS